MVALLDVDLRLALRSKARDFRLDVAFRSTALRTALVGPSGAGKSTLLLALAGLVPDAVGHVRLGDTTLLDSDAGIDRPARERRVGMVFQDYALFPHLTVLENVAFGMRRLGRAVPADGAGRAEALLLQFDLGSLAGAYPRHLSGGQRQRVALARALAPRPGLLLLDEPLSALDIDLRRRLRDELAEMLERVQVPTLIVTHDPLDVAALAQHTLRIEQGRIVAPTAEEPAASLFF